MVAVLLSGAVFGMAHAVWGLGHPSLRALALPVAWTTLLGLALASLYVRGGRSLGPPILAHILIDSVIEPGLILSALG